LIAIEKKLSPFKNLTHEKNTQAIDADNEHKQSEIERFSALN